MDDYLSALFGLVEGVSARPEMAQMGFAIMLGVAVFTLMLAGVLLVSGLTSPLRRRLQALAPEGDTSEATDQGGAGKIVQPLGRYLVPKGRAERARAQERLRHAGLRGNGALATFYGAKLALAVLLPLLAFVVTTAFRLPETASMLFTAAAGIAGFVAPSLWLDRRIKRRTTAIARALPDALDLLVVCTEAGLGLAAAIQRVADDLAVSHPLLCEELTLFNMQTRAGMDNREALRDLEDRTGVEDVRALVTTLLQSMRFGTSVAATLRIYSEELRDKRMQRAEERAAKVGTKMLFPLVLCIFPSFFVVTLGPPILGAMAALGAR